MALPKLCVNHPRSMKTHVLALIFLVLTFRPWNVGLAWATEPAVGGTLTGTLITHEAFASKKLPLTGDVKNVLLNGSP